MAGQSVDMDGVHVGDCSTPRLPVAAAAIYRRHNVQAADEASNRTGGKDRADGQRGRPAKHSEDWSKVTHERRVWKCGLQHPIVMMTIVDWHST